MPISKNLKDRDFAAFRENPNDQGTDRRVADLDAQEKLDKLIGEYDDETQVLAAESLAASFNSPAIDLTGRSKALVRAVWSGITAQDATLVLEVSADGINWGQLGESGIAMIQDNSQIWQFIEIPARYVRLAYTRNANTTGTLDLYWAGKTA